MINTWAELRSKLKQSDDSDSWNRSSLTSLTNENVATTEDDERDEEGEDRSVTEDRVNSCFNREVTSIIWGYRKCIDIVYVCIDE